MDFIINDESILNTHGFIVQNDGGRLERFKSNPVMLYGHKSDFVIGRWQELNLKGKQIISTPDFDIEDAEALKIKGKVDRGFIKGASMGIIIHAAELRKIGDEYVTVVTDWTLLEVSIVSIPSNEAAISLMVYDEKGAQLSTGEIKLNLGALTNHSKNNKTETMNGTPLTASAYTALGIQSTADSAQISEAIDKLKRKSDDAISKLKAIEEKEALALVDTAIEKGKITADRKDAFLNLAVDNYEHAKSILDAIPEKQSLATDVKVDAPNRGELAGIPNDRTDWNYLDWLEKDNKGLAKLRAKHPETFKSLKDSYGQEK